MAAPNSVVTHHADSIDPTLLEWILHEIETILNLGPVAIVVVIGLVMLLLPLGLAIVAIRRQRRKSP